MPHLIVEYDFTPPITDQALENMAKALRPCLEVRNVKRIRTVLSEDRTHGFCEFEAPDAETLREAYRVARVSFRKVWPAQHL
jgi:hypothetical protein